ncbi:MAG: hypothetical protein HYS22_06215 [Deltaproteobacteria bacterium]|nr:hypothetical protein [Deltaproteobacteria bacterium]
MGTFEAVFAELRLLQSHLKAAGNRIWYLKEALALAHQQGQKETDFLPRRLIVLKREEQLKMERLLHQLNQLISTRLDSTFIALDPTDDLKTVNGIRQTIRYIRNAFAEDLSLDITLARLNSTLPGSLKD